MEHIVSSHVMRHLDSNDILVSFQHGFRHRHSCESQLINKIESIARSLNSKGQVDVLILDFEKALTLSHIRDSSVSWHTMALQVTFNVGSLAGY